ncbi:hypothetical protein AB0365_16920 [Brevibacterium casei]|uniref:hypothetical protein n=2 Tax=Brevibacterium casei TaxID=33889 RepID=UPI00344DBC70
MRTKPTSITAAATLAAALMLSLSACGGGGESADSSTAGAAKGHSSSASEADGSATEYPGEFTVANGDSTFRVGYDETRAGTVSATCSDGGGVITATVTESTTGNVFTTTQPEGGSGYAGGTLTLGDGSGEYVWVPLAGIDAEDVRGDTQIFEDESQSGSPVLWNADGTADFGTGIRHETEEGELRVQTPGLLDCSNGAAIPE